MIEFANKNDIKTIIKLWKVCFGDNETYIDNFLSKRMTSSNCLVFREEKDILSMMFLLKGKIKINETIFESFYVYAACTAPKQRRKGLMAQMMKKAEEIAKNNDIDFICLVPATEPLFDYYAKLGFIPCFEKKVLPLSRKQLESIATENANEYNPVSEEISELRNKALSNSDYFIWDNEAVSYAIYENKSTGGENIFAQSSGFFEGYALFYEKDGIVFIRELCVLKGNLGLILKLLISKTKADIFILNLPVNFPLTTDNFEVKKNGMIKPISKNGGTDISKICNAYMGLALD